MIKISKRAAGVPVRTTMTLAGQDFEIELLPWPEKEQSKMFAEFRSYKRVHNPVTKGMELIPFLDWENGNDEKWEKKRNDELDRVVRNFWGVSNENGEPLDGTLRENKLLLGSVKVEDFEEIPIEDGNERAVVKKPRERFFSTLIFDECAKLAGAIAEADAKD